jgi:DNA segregation ATPase FtsK/SpoIIIE, S-DNA-T family
VLGVIFMMIGCFLLISIFSHQSIHYLFDPLQVTDPSSSNFMGPAGHMTATMLGGALGWGSMFLGVALIWAGIFVWRNELWMDSLEVRSKSVLLLAVVGTFLCTSALAFCIWGRAGGGSLGLTIGGGLQRYFGVWGAGTILSVLIITCAAVSTKRSFAQVIKGIFGSGLFLIGFLFGTLPVMAYGALRVVGELAKTAGRFIYLAVTGHEFPQDSEDSEPEVELEVFPKKRGKKGREGQGLDAEIEVIAQQEPARDKLSKEETFSHVVVSRRKPENAGSDKEKARKLKSTEDQNDDKEPDFGEYVRPDLALLARGEIQADSEDDSELLQKSKIIETKLKDFGIQGRITQVHPGPVVTLFEFEPAPGVKVGRIMSLQDDLAMSLRAVAIRVIAPLPKKGTVGIEVPNKNREIVRLRDLLESKALSSEESNLAVPIGKDTYGDPVVADIASMPHLLVAGATGTGKSVCINALLISLIYRTSPADLGLILIDPKILELSIYEGIPHLRVPVVTDPRQAKAVLQWAVKEMERRYRMMQRFGVRNVDGYNAVVRGEKVDGEIIKAPAQEELFEDLNEIPISAAEEAKLDQLQPPGAEPKRSIAAEELKPLSKIVIVIDELADLMLTVGREIEELITRLAQKARAAGIHLIVATQRPSVDVITGLIKANFPARLSFRVTSRIDSRTILDSMGAEKLLGRGDMLIMFPGAVHIRRVHGAYVEDSEVKRVVNSIKSTSKPQYDQRILEMCEKALVDDDGKSADGSASEQQEYDEFYDKAVELVLEKGTASTSMIQRVFRIGYNRAARIIEVMEKDGVIGPMDGVKPREVLIQSLDDRADGVE